MPGIWMSMRISRGRNVFNVANASSASCAVRTSYRSAVRSTRASFRFAGLSSTIRIFSSDMRGLPRVMRGLGLPDLGAQLLHDLGGAFAALLHHRLSGGLQRHAVRRREVLHGPDNH